MIIDHICTGGNAFPQYPSDVGKYGVSIADYFAAHAIMGLVANPNTVTPTTPEALEELAQTAYQIACAMVELREVTPVEPTPVPPEPLPEEITPLMRRSYLHGDAIVVKRNESPPAP